MKTISASGLAVLLLCALPRLASANDFKSTVISAANPSITIDVPGDRFLVIRTFTQLAGGVTRGVVTVTMLNGQNPSIIVQSASIVPTDTTPIEPVNSIVISGPATVVVTRGDTDCFITYRKEAD